METAQDQSLDTIPNTPDEMSIKIREKVKIKIIKKDLLNPEDYFYLKKFEHRIGTILEKNKCKSGKYAYRIEFAPSE